MAVRARARQRSTRGGEDFPQIIHTRWGRQQTRNRSLERTKTKNLYTTLVTDSGPGVGTIWFDVTAGKDEPALVVQRVVGGQVCFSERRVYTLRTFFNRLGCGQLILIGTAGMESRTY